MCGIAGAVALAPDVRPSADAVRTMSACIAHRGPDGEGLWTSPSGRACFAHRRLSVIDLATGQQPMLSEDGRAGLVFNGEVYNYRELRAELERDGVRFRTTSDTEVLLVLCEREGARAVEKLRGMFAFVYWNDRDGTLVMARDRVGKKPLFWCIEGGVLHFASSIRALRRAVGSRWQVDLRAVDRFLDLSCVPAPLTIWDGASKLPAAHLATARVGTPALQIARYWSLAADAPFEGTEAEALDQCDALLQESVALRLRSDVPLGVMLSGGLDSSLVTAVAQRLSTTPILTFTIGFDAADHDESAHAERVARAIGTEHRTFHVSAKLLDLLPAMVEHFGEPFGDSSALPLWVLSEHTRRHVTVALGGDGGDEGFAGYNWYHQALRLQRMGRVVPRGAAAAAGRLLDQLTDASATPSSAAVRQLRRGTRLAALADDGARFAELRTLFGRWGTHRLLAGDLAALRAAEGLPPAIAWLEQLYAGAQGSALRRMRVTDIESYLAECLLPKVDVATMAHGLEARAPLLDQELLRFALRLPDAMHAEQGRGKRLLRRLADRYLAPALLDRPKQGFTVPLDRWFGEDLRPLLEALPSSEALLDRGWFRREGLAQLVGEHLGGRRQHGERLFNLLVLREWLTRHA